MNHNSEVRFLTAKVDNSYSNYQELVQRLEVEIARRQQAEKKLQQYQDNLEELVEARVEKLARVNSNLVHEITDYQKLDSLMIMRERYLAVLAEIQHRLLTVEIKPWKYDQILQLLGQVSQSSRVYLFKNHRDVQGNLLLSQQAEWCAPGIRSIMDNPVFQNLPYQDFLPRWQEILSQGDFIGGKISTFPASEQKILKLLGSEYILILPLIIHGKKEFIEENFIGFIGFDNCRVAKNYDSTEIAFLQAAITDIAMHYQRSLLEEYLHNTKHNLELKIKQRLDELQKTNSVLTSEIAERRKIEKTLQNIILGTASATGKDFFPVLARHLSKALGVRYVLVNEIKYSQVPLFKTLAFWTGNKLEENFEYHVIGTPCEQVKLTGKICFYPDQLQELFPLDLRLPKLKAVSYLGVPLFNSSQKVIGTLCIFHDQPLLEEKNLKSIIKIFAARASAELQRKWAEEELRRAHDQLELRIKARTSELVETNAKLQAEIAEREQVEAELTESEHKYRSVINNLSEVVFQRDLEGHWTFLNPAWTEITGFTIEETLGRHFSEFVHPEDLPSNFQELHTITSDSNFKVSKEVRYLTKNGEYCWVEIHKRILKNTQGETIGISGTMQDITERLLTQKALEKEHLQLRQIITDAPVAMAMLDAQGKYLAHSNQWISDYKLSENFLIGKYHNQVFPNLSQEYKNYMSRVLQGENVSKSEDCLTLANGQLVHLRWAMRPWFTPENHIGGIIIVTQLIDELVTAREEAIETAKTKARFLANMSHEIRTPMNGVIGMTDLLLRTPLNSQQKDFLETLKLSGQNLLMLINDILDFSKLEAGEMRLEKIDFNLNSLLEDILDLLSIQIQDQTIELSAFVQAKSPVYLKGDHSRLRQILLNLAGNAIKFTEQGEVAIKATLVSETVNHATIRFEVKDTGIGIAPEDQKKLFLSFSQVDASTTRKYGGTGLGLAICKQLVELMGGQIGVTSQPDQGSTFWFTITFEKQEIAPWVWEIQQKFLAPLKGQKLLAITANKTIGNLLEQSLAPLEIETTITPDITHAIAILGQGIVNNQIFDYAILEVKDLEEIPTLQHRLNQFNSSLESLHCIWLISSSQYELLKTRAEYQGYTYLFKPIKWSRILNAILKINDPIFLDNVQNTQINGEESNRYYGKKILIVEDTPINQKVLLNELKSLGYQADCANNGSEALEKIGHQQYDLILMDCLMPVLDGYKTTQIIRQKEGEKHHTVIIAMTANALKGEREKCLEAGMDDYISKPVDLETFGKTLEKWLHQIQQTKIAAQKELTVQYQTNDTPINMEQLNSISRGDVTFQKELLQAFMEDAPSYLEAIKTAYESQDFNTLTQRSHQLKGAARMVAIKTLPDLAEQVEIQSKLEKIDNIDELITQMDFLLRKISLFFEEHFCSVSS